MQNRIVPFPIPPRVPAGTSIIAFGDVHGHLDLVEDMKELAQIAQSAQTQAMAALSKVQAAMR